MTPEEAKRFKLTFHFNLWEFLYSETAMEKGLLFQQCLISKDHIANLMSLCLHILQPLRNEMGVSIKINSGYRSEALNLALNGSKTSEHRFGMAADIYIPGKMEQAFHFIKNRCEFRQLIWEQPPGRLWIHVSYNEMDLKKQILHFDGKNYTTWDG